MNGGESAVQEVSSDFDETDNRQSKSITQPVANITTRHDHDLDHYVHETAVKVDDGSYPVEPSPAGHGREEVQNDIDSSCCVQVAVRVRPLLALEGDDENCIQVLRTSLSIPSVSAGNSSTVYANGSTTTATVIQVGGASGPQFTFDQAFGMETDQIQVYESRVAPLIGSCLDGYNATILAYGQTGSGVRFINPFDVNSFH
jgi:hypothetical protein